MKLTEGLVSVVLPIYNVERYLERSIKSVVDQTYINLEILLIDDGSPDNCAEICDKWAEKDSRIKVIHKKNAGLGMARNTGIENAVGEYIYFLDSDDYIALDTIEKCYLLAKGKDADIVTFGCNNVGSDGRITKITIPETEKNVYEGSGVREVFLPDLIGPNIETGKVTNLRMSAWSSFYSLRLIAETGWRFVSERDIISEDYYSQLVLYKDVNKVAVLPEALYFYCENGTSLTHAYRKDRFEKNKSFYKSCIDECNRLSYSDEVKKRVAYAYMSNIIGALKVIARAECGNREKKKSMNEIFSDTEFRAVLTKMSLKKERKARKILLLAIKYRLYPVCRLLVKLKA